MSSLTTSPSSMSQILRSSRRSRSASFLGVSQFPSSDASPFASRRWEKPLHSCFPPGSQLGDTLSRVLDRKAGGTAVDAIRRPMGRPRVTSIWRLPEKLARISCASRRDLGRHVRCWRAAMAVAIELGLRGTSLAADPRFPDWPCNQIKVPEISVAAVWAGPSIDDVGNAWEEDATIRDLVARLAARRTPLDDAQKAIADVITGSEAERQKKAKLIFAGLFKTLNDERS